VSGLPIVVVGAGIGGLALAAALEAVGCEVVVLEQRREMAEVGAGISLWPSALAALDALGVGDQVRAAGSTVASGGIRRPDGTWLTRVDSGLVEASMGEPMIALHRADLIATLAALLDSTTLQFGSTVNDLELRADHVRVLLSDGTVIKGRGLIGADGVRSTIARTLHSDLSLHYAGYTAWRGIADLAIGDHVPSETWGPGGEFGFIPLGAERIYWFATQNTSEAGRSTKGELEYLKRRLATWHQPIPSILAASRPELVLRHDIYDRAGLRHWSNGPVTLIGDAAHPMRPHLGQGGCQAIEDAVVLADALAEFSEPAVAFRSYEAARRRRTTQIVAASRSLGQVIQSQHRFATLMQRVLTMVPTSLALRQMARVGGYQAFHRSTTWRSISPPANR
jgi:2-polyprenyl-6-methoxyphenol hydroxylase-like FAD-dependent oxidoreductase